MQKYVAFLRAINVGGHTVKMDHLRTLFEELDFAKVETFIASGNVIFETTAKSTAVLEKKIKEHLKNCLGYEVDTFLRTMEEVTALEKRSPFKAEKKDKDVYIGFLHETPNPIATSALMALRNKLNDFAFLEREVYWLRLNRDDSIFLKNSLEKILKMSATVRNITTIQKLSEKYKS
jgi:uncharacterized protein (DUF1697 family)